MKVKEMAKLMNLFIARVTIECGREDTVFEGTVCDIPEDVGEMQVVFISAVGEECYRISVTR